MRPYMTTAEILYLALVGEKRLLRAEAEGMRTLFEMEGRAEIGATGEGVFCKGIGLNLYEVVTADGPLWNGDVAGFEVKATRSPYGQLLIPETQHDHALGRIYVLVRLHRLPVGIVVGWQYGHLIVNGHLHDGTRYGYPSYYRADALRPMETLPAVAPR